MQDLHADTCKGGYVNMFHYRVRPIIIEWARSSDPDIKVRKKKAPRRRRWYRIEEGKNLEVQYGTRSNGFTAWEKGLVGGTSLRRYMGRGPVGKKAVFG